MHVNCHSLRVFLKNSCICRRLHYKFACSTRTGITMSWNSRAYWDACIDMYASDSKRDKLKQWHNPFSPLFNRFCQSSCYYSSNKSACWQTRVSGIKLLESCAHVIYICLTSRKQKGAYSGAYSSLSWRNWSYRGHFHRVMRYAFILVYTPDRRRVHVECFYRRMHSQTSSF